jgi:Undecaprenyl-phosphate glucose phosphotransferase
MARNLKNHRLDLVIVDLLIVNFALLIALLLNEQASLTIDLKFFILFLFSNVIWVVVSLIQKNYKWKERVRFEKELPVLWISILSYLALLLVFEQLILTDYLSMNTAIYHLIILSVIIPVIRLVLRLLKLNKVNPFNYVVVGGKETNIQHIFESFEYVYQGKANCLGRFGNLTHEMINNIGDYSELKEYIKNSENVDKIFYVNSELDNKEVREIMQLCQTKFIDFDIIPREVDLFPRGVKVEFLDDLPVILLKEEPLFKLRNKILKRTFDIIFSSVVLILIFSWLFPIIAILIRLESKGPIFFIQNRPGYKGSIFPCYKFRSMTMNHQTEKQAVKNDARITKIGVFLRKTSLDEFPQFLNVFLGHMSVVGPRPNMIQQMENYSKLIEIYMIRHQVKQGITGWAQVNGYRGPTEQLEKMINRVKYDVWYIENWSFWLDIKCIFLTVYNVIKGEENAF